MTKSTIILIAATTIATGIPAKDSDDPIVIKAGEELTPALAKILGLKAKELAEWVERGILEETTARVAEGGGNESLALSAAQDRATNAEAELAAERKRAADAEAKVAALEKQLEEAKAGGKGQGGS